MNTRRSPILISAILLAVILAGLAAWQPAQAEPVLFLAQQGTLEVGKQGLFLNNVPFGAHFVEVNVIQPPIAARYHIGVEIAYRAPVLNIEFQNLRGAPVNPFGTQTYVYFNIAGPERKLWDESGVNEIAIWYFDEKEDAWQLCNTLLVEEKQDNGKYDRLACLLMGNGHYMLGKLEFDPIFRELYRPFDKSDTQAGLLTLID